MLILISKQLPNLNKKETYKNAEIHAENGEFMKTFQLQKFVLVRSWNEKY
jgi:hypothetical protein